MTYALLRPVRLALWSGRCQVSRVRLALGEQRRVCRIRERAYSIGVHPFRRGRGNGAATGSGSGISS